MHSPAALKSQRANKEEDSPEVNDTGNSHVEGKKAEKSVFHILGDSLSVSTLSPCDRDMRPLLHQLFHIAVATQFSLTASVKPSHAPSFWLSDHIC